jgi:pimeloyl-ACP methyl ester carboxylesterase
MYFTTKKTFAGDLVAGIKFVEEKEGSEVVLVGHSAGGALSQYTLSEGIGGLRVKALVLIGAVPGFGA